MIKPIITIAIPTYNRSQMLSSAIATALDQIINIDYEVLVLDNASTDDTESVVNSFKSEKLRYVKNSENIGMRANWNKAVQESLGKYLMVLGDDDWLHPNFLEESFKVFQQQPDLGFTFARCNKVDNDKRPMAEWGYKFAPAGLLRGEEYLFHTLDFECCITNSTTTLINKKVFDKVGLFEAEFGKNTFDFNMWVKIATEFDVYFIDKFLSDYRIHPDQISEEHWRTSGHPTGRIGTYLELLKVISILEGKESKLFEQNFLNQKMVTVSHALTELISSILPDL